MYVGILFVMSTALNNQLDNKIRRHKVDNEMGM